jgi:hypothetical protein
VASKDLTPEQRNVLFFAAAKRRDWFATILERAKAQQWPADDPVVLAAERARAAAHELVQAAYASGPTGAGMPDLPSRREVMEQLNGT